jgi:catechol 2,3-dioxygenase-like lactoylglutathione lyase family enzyme
MNEAKTYGLSHLAIAVHDLQRTLRFYQQVFDMELMYQEEHMIQLTTPGCNDIIVFEKSLAGQIGITGGIAHFGFRLRNPEDIEIMKDQILRAGGEIVQEGEFIPGSPYIFFKDPDGYTIEVWYELLPVAT